MAITYRRDVRRALPPSPVGLVMGSGYRQGETVRQLLFDGFAAEGDEVSLCGAAIALMPAYGVALGVLLCYLWRVPGPTQGSSVSRLIAPRRPVPEP
jgi:hypothetical protein